MRRKNQAEKFMPQAPSEARPMPRWLAVVGSIVIAAHLVAIGCRALTAQSGPWVMQLGSSMARPPQFAMEIDELTTPSYLRPLRMTHNYHFLSNHPEQLGVSMEVVLKDDKGSVLKTLNFPDEKANFWLRHRQLVLARGLAEDQPVVPPQGESVAAPGKQAPSVEIWDAGEGKMLQIRSVQEHLIPRNRPVFRPNDWARLLARSYARYLCREHGAASAEIIRHTKEPLLSGVLLEESAPNPEELVATFGEMKR
jgi:hypothetical protein